MISNENACAEVKEKGISWLAGRIKGSSGMGVCFAGREVGGSLDRGKNGWKIPDKWEVVCLWEITAVLEC